jgi:hypothetical protein
LSCCCSGWSGRKSSNVSDMMTAAEEREQRRAEGSEAGCWQRKGGAALRQR